MIKQSGEVAEILECVLNERNNVHTISTPFAELIKSLKRPHPNKRCSHTKLISAFSYEEYVAVTLEVSDSTGFIVYCRYYDCLFREVGEPFAAKIFPDHTVFCARRIGADYIAISNSTNKNELVHQVKIQARFGEYQHFFTVCLNAKSQGESRFFQIAEFIEYHKMQGATFFQVYLQNITDYDRLLIEDYSRTGDIEYIKFENSQNLESALKNDCYFRNKGFSKWTIFLDLDEKIEVKQDERVVDYLRKIDGVQFTSLDFKIHQYPKMETHPIVYSNLTVNENTTIFQESNRRLEEVEDYSEHLLVQSDQMIISLKSQAFPEVKRQKVSENVAVIRKYIKTKRNSELLTILGKFSTNIEKELPKKITKRIKYVYDIVDVECFKKEITYLRHGGMNVPCYVEMVKNQTALIGTSKK
ncbi:unnamed protein product [Caenorhabditis bovis]|uniref:Glycosyltransferase family 92 protein n=1 Tax=Caenorhabditis bovis TaxID=2654633 RepID=A0A8S1EAL0_9PELO|nr:unnamed protein product [Caenorhabditis bovis]